MRLIAGVTYGRLARSEAGASAKPGCRRSVKLAGAAIVMLAVLAAETLGQGLGQTLVPPPEIPESCHRETSGSGRCSALNVAARFGRASTHDASAVDHVLLTFAARLDDLGVRLSAGLDALWSDSLRTRFASAALMYDLVPDEPPYLVPVSVAFGIESRHRAVRVHQYAIGLGLIAGLRAPVPRYAVTFWTSPRIEGTFADGAGGWLKQTGFGLSVGLRYIASSGVGFEVIRDWSTLYAAHASPFGWSVAITLTRP